MTPIASSTGPAGHDALSDACDAGLLTDDELLMVRIEYALAGGDPAILERGVALAEGRASLISQRA